MEDSALMRVVNDDRRRHSMEPEKKKAKLTRNSRPSIPRTAAAAAAAPWIEEKIGPSEPPEEDDDIEELCRITANVLDEKCMHRDAKLQEIKSLESEIETYVKYHKEALVRAKQCKIKLQHLEREEAIEILERKKSIVRAHFGEPLIELTNRVSKGIRNSQFACPPIGPFVSMLNITSCEWSCAVLNALGNDTLSAFLVLTDDDRKKLNDIINMVDWSDLNARPNVLLLSEIQDFTARNSRLISLKRTISRPKSTPSASSPAPSSVIRKTKEYLPESSNHRARRLQRRNLAFSEFAKKISPHKYHRSSIGSALAKESKQLMVAMNCTRSDLGIIECSMMRLNKSTDVPRSGTYTWVCAKDRYEQALTATKWGARSVSNQINTFRSHLSRHPNRSSLMEMSHKLLSEVISTKKSTQLGDKKLPDQAVVCENLYNCFTIVECWASSELQMYFEAKLLYDIASTDLEEGRRVFRKLRSHFQTVDDQSVPLRCYFPSGERIALEEDGATSHVAEESKIPSIMIQTLYMEIEEISGRIKEMKTTRSKSSNLLDKLIPSRLNMIEKRLNFWRSLWNQIETQS